MTVFQCLRQGARSLHQARRMLLVFYTAATLPAVFGAAVVMTVPFNSLRHSTWAVALGNNLDASWIGELIAQSTVPALPMLAAVVGLAVGVDPVDEGVELTVRALRRQRGVRAPTDRALPG